MCSVSDPRWYGGARFEIPGTADTQIGPSGAARGTSGTERDLVVASTRSAHAHARQLARQQRFRISSGDTPASINECDKVHGRVRPERAARGAGDTGSSGPSGRGGWARGCTAAEVRAVSKAVRSCRASTKIRWRSCGRHRITNGTMVKKICRKVIEEMPCFGAAGAHIAPGLPRPMAMQLASTQLHVYLSFARSFTLHLD